MVKVLRKYKFFEEYENTSSVSLGDVECQQCFVGKIKTSPCFESVSKTYIKTRDSLGVSMLISFYKDKAIVENFLNDTIVYGYVPVEAEVSVEAVNQKGSFFIYAGHSSPDKSGPFFTRSFIHIASLEKASPDTIKESLCGIGAYNDFEFVEEVTRLAHSQRERWGKIREDGFGESLSKNKYTYVFFPRFGVYVSIWGRRFTKFNPNVENENKFLPHNMVEYVTG